MIPRFNKYGYLPRGAHRSGLAEVKRLFGGGSAQREELFKGICAIAELLRKHKKHVKKFLLNGSYVTSKKEPGDFDCIVILKEGFDFSSPEAKRLKRSKELFNGHILAVMEEDAAECRRLIGFFGHDRDRKPKGLVEVIL